jgi:hypothetical protein
VSISGTVGKALIKKHQSGAIKLIDENVTKLKTSGLLPASATTKPKTASPKKSVKSSAATSGLPTTYPCKTPSDIYSPITKRCVKIDGAAGKKVIKAYQAKQLALFPENVAKIEGSSGTKTTAKASVHVAPKTKVAMKTNKPMGATPVPSPIAKRIHKFVEEWKKNKEAQLFKSEGHKSFCKNNKIMELEKPIVHSSLNIEFPIQRMQGAIQMGGFSIESLNSPNQKFTLERIQGINFQFNNYSLHNILYKGTKDTLAYFEDTVDMTWLKDMNNYIMNLSTKDIYTIIGYTFYGDTVSNNYMRRRLNKQMFMNELSAYDKWISVYYPLFFQAVDYLDKDVSDVKKILRDGKDNKVTVPGTVGYVALSDKTLANKQMEVSEVLKLLKNNTTMKTSDKYLIFYAIGRFLSFSEFWQNVIRLYIQDLETIIQKAPALKKPLVVYRGVKDDYYLKGQEGNVYTTDGFVSTSINLGSALRFAGVKCCFKRITLLPGTRTLLLAGVSKFKQEFEILLSNKSKFYITKGKKFMQKSTVDMCPNKVSQITVTDVVVIK